MAHHCLEMGDIYRVVHMQQVIVELDDRTMERLNRVAPPSARKRSEFIREAIRRALNERLEADMERAYSEQPPEGTEVDLDPSTWEAPAKKRKAKR
jgi:predicted transcriptional regulator